MDQWLSASQEFLTEYSLFYRTNAIRRVSDLNSKIANSSAAMVLPKNPMLHLLDNFSHNNQSTDTFEITNYPFLASRNNIKYLHHYIDFDHLDKNSLDKFSHRIYRSKLFETLRTFNMAHRQLLIPTQKLDTMMDNKNCVIVENYNPLYRIIPTNQRAINYYYQYKLILLEALKNAAKCNRQNFLVIPVPEGFTYNRTNLMAITQSEDISSTRLLSNSHFYFFIIDLVALLLDNESKLSTFNEIDKRALSALNVMLTYHDKSIVFNIGTLTTLASSKSYIFNFIDNISRITLSSVVASPITTEDQTDEEIVEEKQEDTVTVVNHAVQNSAINTPAILNNKVDKVVDKQSLPVSTQEEKPIIKIEPNVVAPKPEKIENLKADKLLPKLLNQQPNLSEKQLNRIEVLANKHKTIVVKTPSGDKTIEQILSEPVDINIETKPLTVEHDDGVSKDMLHSSVIDFNSQYREKLMRKDILTNIVAFKDNGLYLTDYSERNDYNGFTNVKHVKATFHDIKGKKHTVNFKLPMPDDEGYYLVNGVRLSMSNQMVNVPICKISPTRVSLISNYNKTLVDKVGSTRHSLVDHIIKKAGDLGIKYIPKSNTYIGLDLPYDYKQLGAKFSRISTKECLFYFEYSDRIYSITNGLKLLTSIFTGYESTYGVLVGRSLKNEDVFIFMNKTNECTEVNVKTNNIIQKDIPITQFLNGLQVPDEWCNLKILDKNLPIVFILAYRYGLSAILKNLKINHRFIPNNVRTPWKQQPTELVVQFADGALIFDRYPLQHSYILSGLNYFSTLKYCNIIDLDGKDIYYKLISDKGMSTNYLKGIDAYFSFFIDPITKEILHEMGEPTNTRDLLIRAVDMLVDDTDKEPSSISNFRIRCDEKIPAMIYNEISRQYANYINSNFKDVSFSINTEAIFQRIIQDEAMILREDINPVHAIKDSHRVTYAGFGGRSSEAFVARDRKYPNDAVGILSESTTDSGTVGMVASLSSNPKLKNIRGMFDTSGENLTTANIFSDVSMLMPSSNHDDPKRAAFTSNQMSHHIPTANLKPMRYRTGFEMVIPQKTSDFFVARAKRNGVVTNIDNNLKLITITYDDQTTDVIEYGDIHGEVSGMTINHKIAVAPNIKVGVKIKANSVITFHDEFFQLDPTSNQLSWCHGVPAKVAIMPKDVTLEDSNMITAELADKLSFDSVYTRPIQITTDMVIEAFADIGTKVSFNDPLIRLKYEDTADIIGDVDELFAELKQVEYRSKHNGEVVGIQVYHVAESLNQSLTKFVNSVTYKSRRRGNIAKGSLKEAKFTPVVIVPDGTRIKGVQLSSSDVLVVFYIKTKVACGIGDKIVFGNMLKSVVGKIEHNPITAENGDKIDAVFGANSIYDRIVCSVFINSISDTVLEKAEQDVLAMYFDE